LLTRVLRAGKKTFESEVCNPKAKIQKPKSKIGSSLSRLRRAACHARPWKNLRAAAQWKRPCRRTLKAAPTMPHTRPATAIPWPPPRPFRTLLSPIDERTMPTAAETKATWPCLGVRTDREDRPDDSRHHARDGEPRGFLRRVRHGHALRNRSIVFCVSAATRRSGLSLLRAFRQRCLFHRSLKGCHMPAPGNALGMRTPASIPVLLLPFLPRNLKGCDRPAQGNALGMGTPYLYPSFFLIRSLKGCDMPFSGASPPSGHGTPAVPGWARAPDASGPFRLRHKKQKENGGSTLETPGRCPGLAYCSPSGCNGTDSTARP